MRVQNGALAANANIAGSYKVAPPPEPVTATGLINEIGRRTVDLVQFAYPSDSGTIQTPNNNFAVSAIQTDTLAISVAFAFSDAPDASIAEIGIFSTPTFIAGLPPGQRYFAPAQMTDPGTLVSLEYSMPVSRAPNTRPYYMHLLTL